ncbi:glycosyltransferase [Synechococcales cyanobacterium C]|uniref:Glycosyltransferase n=1 Tax=Petrachloros mirabilis ULC683 TaxID=2781853 RepID=A0A8K2A841_9CYAN|nr:glycosyltransferase [Petrachloros mirabilis]NCJ07581.1 glycosyltransferase [Petrachloros mirabilis ULC683]
MKLMVYSHDAFGLGNIRRMMAICDYLLKALPDLSILVVSGSAALHQLRLPKGLDYIKLPCLGRDEVGTLGVRFLHTEVDETVQLRSQLIRTVAAHFQPDLLLVDKKPDGLKGELQPTLDDLQRYRPEARRVLLLRDILDSPEATVAQWQHHHYYTTAENHYDQVWIVGTPDIFDAPQHYQFPPGLRAKTRFTGYVRRGCGRRSALEMRQSLGLSATDPLVLVTPGGGGDGFRLVNTYLQALAMLPPDQTLTSVIIGGPELPAAQKPMLLRHIETTPRTQWLDFTDDLASYMVAADAVVSMGGYNTVCEILSLGKRAIIVPRTEPVQEQWIRAERMAQMGLFEVIHPDHLTPEALMQSLLSQLAAPMSQPPTAIDMDALPRITNLMLGLLKPKPCCFDRFIHPHVFSNVEVAVS